MSGDHLRLVGDVREIDYSNLPDPELLEVAAENETPRVTVDMYWNVIRVLRGKGFSWLDVSVWLKSRGVELHAKRLSRFAETQEDDKDEGKDAPDALNGAQIAGKGHA